jgi:hypothetical protein
MPYRIQRSGSQYAVVDDKGKTVGTHPTKSKATEQVRALYANVVEAGKNNAIRYGRRRSGVGDSHSGINVGGATISAADKIKELSSVVKEIIGEISENTTQIVKAMPNLKEGDFAMTAHGGDEEFHIGQVVHVMREGMLGIPGGEYTLEATPENPAVLIQLFEQDEDGLWEATRTYSACTMSLFIAINPLPVEPELTVEDMPNMNSQPDLMDAYDNSVGKKDKPNYASIISERKGKPADGQLYTRVIRAAKDKFDVYPSAVANAWVVAEYKRRGGTYKADATESKTIWDGSLLDSKDFIK